MTSTTRSTIIRWTVFSYDDTFYFFRVLHLNDMYIGSWVSTDTLLASIVDYSDSSYPFYFSTPGGALLTNRLSVQLPPGDFVPYSLETIDSEQMFVVSNALKSAPFYLTMLIPASEIYSNIHLLSPVILVLALGLIFIWLPLLFAVRIGILHLQFISRCGRMRNYIFLIHSLRKRARIFNHNS